MTISKHVGFHNDYVANHALDWEAAAINLWRNFLDYYTTSSIRPLWFLFHSYSAFHS
jgi:hypothetical protein